MNNFERFYLTNCNKLRFINSCNKIPKLFTKVGTAIQFKEWEKRTLKENYKLDYFKSPNEIDPNLNIGYGLICGEQLDRSYIICFDFDINSKTEHRHLLKDCFENLTTNNFDGVFQTSTEGNYQMLIHVKEESHLNYLKCMKKIESNEDLNKFESKHGHLKGLEFMLKTHIVLPPSKTICKKSNIYRERKFLSNVYVRVMDNKLFNFMKDAYETYIEEKQIKSSKEKIYINEKTFIENTQEQEINLSSTEINKIKAMCDIINDEYIDNYNDWFQLVYPLKSYNLKELAIDLSKRSIKFQDTNNQFYGLWNDKSTNSIGKIFNYARKSNEKKYFEVLDNLQHNKNKNLLLNLYDRNNFRKYVNYIEKET